MRKSPSVAIVQGGSGAWQASALAQAINMVWARAYQPGQRKVPCSKEADAGVQYSRAFTRKACLPRHMILQAVQLEHQSSKLIMSDFTTPAGVVLTIDLRRFSNVIV